MEFIRINNLPSATKGIASSFKTVVYATNDFDILQ